MVQERLIGPDGSFAVFGRSLAYRCGAFQHLAQVTLQQLLPPELPVGQVRSALTAVIRRTLEPKGTFDAKGWLQIGLCGHQPGIGEGYISTGSLYLCTTAFLPLGLPPTHAFWAEPAQDCGYKWTALNHDKSVLTPTVSKDKLMRDPCVIRGKGGLFHMVWTTAKNCWAPEITYDAPHKQYRI